jgi:hypothetical protein
MPKPFHSRLSAVVYSLSWSLWSNSFLMSDAFSAVEPDGPSFSGR